MLSINFLQDSWSFGITLWELFSKGMIPYFDKSNSETIETVIAGYRLPKPTECPDEIYQLMEKCWNNLPAQRPNFEEILNVLSETLEKYAPKSPVTPKEENEPRRAVSGGVYAHTEILNPSASYNDNSSN